MIRKSSILVLFLYLFSALLPVSVKVELGKLDQLMAHYLEHKDETPALSALGFLKMHYGEEYGKHQSDHNHSNLPGKETPAHSHTIACGWNAFALPASLAFVVNTPLLVKRTSVHSEERLLSSSLASGIWQPPRMG